MKRYMVFGGSCYHPSGGAEDFLQDFDVEEAAVAFAKGFATDALKWVHVYDTKDRKIVWSY